LSAPFFRTDAALQGAAQRSTWRLAAYEKRLLMVCVFRAFTTDSKRQPLGDRCASWLE
jgi:hypothetical protein